MKKSQTQDILNYLKKHKKGITSLQAFELFGATRLSSIIYQLRHRRGLNIVSEDKVVKTRYGNSVGVSCYKLVD